MSLNMYSLYKKKPFTGGMCIGIYPGQYYDDETGLNYNYHRYYDPTIGRYIRTDPIELTGGINFYPYVLNNPVNFFDPMGLNTFEECMEDCLAPAKKELKECLKRSAVVIKACKAACWPFCIASVLRGVNMSACLESCWQKCEAIDIMCWYEYAAKYAGCWYGCKSLKCP